MAIDIKPRGKEPDLLSEQSRITVSRGMARTFKKLCKYTKSDSDGLLEKLIVHYIRCEKLDVRIVKKDDSDAK